MEFKFDLTSLLNCIIELGANVKFQFAASRGQYRREEINTWLSKCIYPNISAQYSNMQLKISYERTQDFLFAYDNVFIST